MIDAKVRGNTDDTDPLMPLENKPRRPHLRGVQSEVTRHGKKVYYFRHPDGGRVRLPDSFGSDSFMEAYAFAAKDLPIPSRLRLPSPQTREYRGKIGRALMESVIGAANRAKVKGIEFDIDHDWIMGQLDAQSMKCAVTRLKFYAQSTARSFRNPYAPSLDRKNPKLGYTRDNVRIVLLAVNTMLMDWGEDEFEPIAEAFLRKRGR
jgi:hypothetical protein